jgi:hypothetical protein
MDRGYVSAGGTDSFWLWAGMFQGGELDLQSGCDGFDSRPVHDERDRALITL